MHDDLVAGEWQAKHKSYTGSVQQTKLRDAICTIRGLYRALALNQMLGLACPRHVVFI